MQPEINPSALGRRHVITTELVEAMRQVEEGQLFSYDQILEITQLTKTKSYGYIQSAKKILENEYGMVFENEINAGYRRLHHGEIPSTANRKHVAKLKSNAKRFRNKLEAVNPTELSPSEQITYTLGITNLHVMESLTDPRSQRALRKQIVSSSDATKQLDKEKILDSLKGFG
jgi:hypothetical protein